MLRLNCELHIGQYKFTMVNNVEIESTWEKLTDTAKIPIPQKFWFKGKYVVVGKDALLNIGDRVKIWLGYFPDKNLVFDGFLTDIKPGKPVELQCEDMMWLFKRFSFTKSWSAVTLANLLDYIKTEAQKSKFWPQEGIRFQPVIEADLGSFKIDQAAASLVFDELRKKYCMDTFVRDGTLYCGLSYVPALMQTVKFSFTDNIVKHDLTWTKETDSAIKVKAVGIDLKTNKRIEVTVGDPDGAVRTLSAINPQSKDSLAQWALRQLPKLKFTGYKGTFTAFGKPWVRHQYIVNLTDKQIPEREGNYMVKQVKTTFGMSGFRQEITLDMAADTVINKIEDYQKVYNTSIQTTETSMSTASPPASGIKNFDDAAQH